MAVLCYVSTQKKERVKYLCLDSLMQILKTQGGFVRLGTFGLHKFVFPPLFQGGQRALQKKGSPVPSHQRALARAPRGGPLPPQSLRLQRQQQRLLTRQSQEPAISLTARQEYVEPLVSPSPDAEWSSFKTPVSILAQGGFKNMRLESVNCSIG